MSNVIIKGKTLVPQGHYRGRDLDGQPIRWTSDEQSVEVSEAQAALIETDKMVACVRVNPDEASAQARAADLASENQRLHEDHARLRGAHEQLLEELAALRAAAASPPPAPAAQAEKPKGGKVDAAKPATDKPAG